MTGLLSPLLKRMRINAVLHHKGEGRSLDFGCGDRSLERFIDDYTGIDKGDPLPFMGEFETVYMLAVLEHLDKPKTVLDCLRLALSENGRIVLTTPTRLGNFVHWLGDKVGLFSCNDEHLFIYNRKSIIALGGCVGMKLTHYKRFQLGLNQIAVLSC